MKTYILKKLNEKNIKTIFERKVIPFAELNDIVYPIMEEIKQKGDKAVIKYAKKFDKFNRKGVLISQDELKKASDNIDADLKEAIDNAYNNILKFHKPQKPKDYSLEIYKGIDCSRKFFPIESVGLYIPGGSAVLISTMLMLGIPAKIAGCKRKVVCSTLKDDEINAGLAYAALKCEIDEFYSVGGVQAIAMMGYGTEKVEKVDKIFGPGNQYVTAAKNLISLDSKGCLIDMPAGPSEVLIIADKTANAEFIASDLLSQAEHGNDSQVILLTDSNELSEKVKLEISGQINKLSRSNFVMNSLNNSFVVITETLDEAINLSNMYAPEHLIINTKNFKELSKKIINAGSVFLGAYSPESAGDYASGTNHSLPTNGYAKAIGGISVESFMKPITFQTLSKEGLKKLSKTIMVLAKAEKLDAHAKAVKIRM